MSDLSFLYPERVHWMWLALAFVGVLAAAQDSEDVYVVGSVVDVASVAPEVTVGSAVFNWEELGYQEASGMLVDGKTHILGIPENGIIPIINDNLSAEGKKAVEEAVEGLIAGDIPIQP